METIDNRFYKEYNNIQLYDDGSRVSEEYKKFQRRHLNFMKKVANAIDGQVVRHTNGHYYESYSIQTRNGYIYINHERLDRTLIDFDSNDFYLYRTQKSPDDYHGGANCYSSFSDLVDNLKRLA